jgi:hypothetical protein
MNNTDINQLWNRGIGGRSHVAQGIGGTAAHTLQLGRLCCRGGITPQPHCCGHRRSRRAVQRKRLPGAYRQAGVEAASALAAPALMSYASTCSLVKEVVDGAFDLGEPAIGEGDIQPFRHQRTA